MKSIKGQKRNKKNQLHQLSLMRGNEKDRKKDRIWL